MTTINTTPPEFATISELPEVTEPVLSGLSDVQLADIFIVVDDHGQPAAQRDGKIKRTKLYGLGVSPNP